MIPLPLQQIYTIAQNTFVEGIRQPIFTVVVVVFAFALLMNPSFAAYTLTDDNKMLVEISLSTLFLSGLFLGAFTATGVISEEIESRTVMTVVSKPIPRPLFVLGKFLGIVAAITLAYIALSLFFLLTVRHGVMQARHDRMDQPVWVFGGLAVLGSLLYATIQNYMFRKVFTSNFIISLTLALLVAYPLVLIFGPSWGFQPITRDFFPIDPSETPLTQLMLAMLMVYQAVLILVAVAILASTRVGQVMTVLICLGVFFVGLVSGSFLGQFEDDNAAVWVLYRIVPNLQLMWAGEALTTNARIELEHVAKLAVYSGSLVLGFLALAVAFFQTREVG